MLEGKSEKLEFQKMLSSPHRKIEVNKSKTKMLKNRTKKIGESKEMMKRDKQRDK